MDSSSLIEEKKLTVILVDEYYWKEPIRYFSCVSCIVPNVSYLWLVTHLSFLQSYGVL
jgi:hypothetical protein